MYKIPASLRSDFSDCRFARHECRFASESVAISSEYAAMRQTREAHRLRGGPDFGIDPTADQAALAEAVLQSLQEEQARTTMREALRQAVREMRNETDMPRSKAITESAKRVARRIRNDGGLS